MAVAGSNFFQVTKSRGPCRWDTEVEDSGPRAMTWVAVVNGVHPVLRAAVQRTTKTVTCIKDPHRPQRSFPEEGRFFPRSFLRGRKGRPGEPFWEALSSPRVCLRSRDNGSVTVDHDLPFKRTERCLRKLYCEKVAGFRSGT